MFPYTVLFDAYVISIRFMVMDIIFNEGITAGISKLLQTIKDYFAVKQSSLHPLVN